MCTTLNLIRLKASEHFCLMLIQRIKRAKSEVSVKKRLNTSAACVIRLNLVGVAEHRRVASVPIEPPLHVHHRSVFEGRRPSITAVLSLRFAAQHLCLEAPSVQFNISATC